MIKLSHITKIYRNKKNETLALNDISIVFPNKGLITILGPSGSGKTTLANIICNYDDVNFGEVIFAIENLNTSNQLLYQNITLLDQENIFLYGLSVGENIKFLYLLQGKDISDQQLIEEMKMLDLFDCVTKKIYELSTGQKQRVAFLRSKLKDSILLIADEPTANLDNYTEMLLFNELVEISKQKLVITITHNRDLAYQVSDRVIEVKNGKITQNLKTKNDENNIVNIKNDTIAIKKNQLINENMLNQINTLLVEKKEIRLKIANDYCDIPIEDETKDYADHFMQKINRFNKKALKKIGKNKFITKGKKIILNNILLSILIFFIYLIFYSLSISESELLSNINNDNLIPYTVMSVDDNLFIENNIDIQQDFNYLTKNKDGIYAGMVDADYYFSIQHPITLFDTEKIYGFLIFDYDVNVIFGHFPATDEYLITDYIADFIIKKEIYNSYEEIINLGLEFEGTKFSVSGIIQTDYKKYSMLDTQDENLIDQSKMENEFLLDREYLYARFYIPKTNIETVINEGSIRNYGFNNLSETYELKIYNFERISEITYGSDHQLYVPISLYEELNQSGSPLYLKTRSRNTSITGYYDNAEEHIIYVDIDTFSLFVMDYYSVNSILIKSNEMVDLEYFINREYSYKNYISEETALLMFYVDLIQRNNTVILIFIILLFIVISNSFVYSNITNDRKLLYLLKSNGFSKLNFNILYLFEVISIIAFCMFTTSILIISLSSSLNNAVSINSFYIFRIVRFSTIILLHTFLLLGSILIVEYVYISNSIFNNKVIKLKKGK